VLLIAPKEHNQPNYSDKQGTHVVRPDRSQRKNDWPEENQNIYQACGDSPAARRGPSLKDGPPSRSSDSGYNNLEQYKVD
jgi:hypothetical protein